MTTTAWGHLPNAKHIDAVILSLKNHPDEWGAAAARDAALDSALDEARDAAWLVARLVAREAALDAARGAARNAARGAALDAALDAAWAARSVVSALVAWDHAAKYLDMTQDELGVWHALSEDPACILLLPYAHARELIAAKEGIMA